MPSPCRELALDEIRRVGKATTRQIAEALDLKVNTVQTAMQINHQAGRVRVVGWAKVHSNYAMVWAVANGEPDKPKPSFKRKLLKLASQRRWRENNRLKIAMKNYINRGKPVPYGFQLTYKPKDKT